MQWRSVLSGVSEARERGVDSSEEWEAFGQACTDDSRIKMSRSEMQQPLGIDCDDGTENVSRKNEVEFMEWLTENGARLEKLDWPSRNTVSGVRGAVAKVDIEAYEPMLEIPLELIIYPRVCYACPELSDVYAKNRQLFSTDDDLVIALFLMHEKLKGRMSFYHPYIKMLPRPCGVSDWNEAEQAALQDRVLCGESRRRPVYIRRIYDTLWAALEPFGQDRFQPSLYTYDLFSWAWMIIQSRAFGRRLPWTALVPFADCLNHQNVATKYDLVESRNLIPHEEEKKEELYVANDVKEGRDMYFRLYPSGCNRYPCGTEAFNSYGRRSNRFLLLEYGFCLPDNEWDTYELCVQVDQKTPFYGAKCELLRQLGLGRVKTFKLERRALNRELLTYLRIINLPEELVLEQQEEANPGVLASLCQLWMRKPDSLHEQSVLLHLKQLLLREVSLQQTTLEQDQAELDSESIPPRHRAALLYRIGRKKIVHDQLRMTERKLAGLALEAE